MDLFQPILKGEGIYLEYANPSHFSELIQVGSDDRIWQVARPKNQDIDAFINDYVKNLLQSHQSGSTYAYIVKESQTGKIVGSTRYYDIAPHDKRVSLGYTWYHPNYWGKGINPKAKYAMLSQIFERLNWNRVEFHVDARNQRSIAAMTYLGATRDGILHQHKIVQGDFVRDTVLFSITRNTWPEVKQKLEQRLNPAT
jgi:N-acetyltransferase